MNNRKWNRILASDRKRVTRRALSAMFATLRRHGHGSAYVAAGMHTIMKARYSNF